MITGVLFDLDGTLLHMDQDEFAHAYYDRIGACVAHLMLPEQFVRHLMQAAVVMMQNSDGATTNQQVFFADFFARLAMEPQTILPVLDTFYERDFAALRSLTHADVSARKAVEAVLQYGADAVVATNPIFPRNAVKQRLSWAGLADLPFKLITTYEDSHFCKPQLEYYREITQKIGHRPEECLMIGNDVGKDLVAGQIGMKTYLVTDDLINSEKIQPKADYQGTLADLARDIAPILAGYAL